VFAPLVGAKRPPLQQRFVEVFHWETREELEKHEMTFTKTVRLKSSPVSNGQTLEDKPFNLGLLRPTVKPSYNHLLLSQLVQVARQPLQ
jgi:hypothetical protein